MLISNTLSGIMENKTTYPQNAAIFTAGGSVTVNNRLEFHGQFNKSAGGNDGKYENSIGNDGAAQSWRVEQALPSP